MKNKRIILISILIGVIAFFFWTSSRYPQLNEKALMGGDMPTTGISFDIIYEIDEDVSRTKKIFYHTLNWIETNKKGMTFGIIFAAALILLFSQISERQFKNRYLNSFIGLIMGVPLGVCVNCAAPIAVGIKGSGGRAETALATMISSPTLNIIVLSMLFSLFPIYLVTIKLGLTFLFILVFIPLLTSYFPPEKQESVVTLANNTNFQFAFTPSELKGGYKDNWLSAFQWLGYNFIHSLWFIIKIAVPLMLLAGIIGNIFITLLPFEDVVSYLPKTGRLVTMLAMVLIAIFGIILPVPMTFDIIIVAILINLGLPIKYSMILLFSLGIFSIYSYLVLLKVMPKQLVFSLVAIILVLAITSGVLAHYWEKRINHINETYYFKLLRNTKKEKTWEIEKSINTIFSNEIKDGLLAKVDSIKQPLVFSKNGLEIYSSKFVQKSSSTKDWFQKLEGSKIGLDLPWKYSLNECIYPFSTPRSVATGDLNKDGYPDCVMVSKDSIYLYSNIKGTHFNRNPLPFYRKRIYGAALVDINNDSWLDIFVTTFKEGNYILFNDKGNFNNKIEKLPIEPQSIVTMSPAFADIDKSGQIDIFLGNWYASHTGLYSVDSAHNYGFLNKHPEWEKFEIGGKDGETLSTLLSDFNMDGHIDLVEGNDFIVPDFFYHGNGQGKFDRITRQDQIIPESPRFTMNAITTDIDNDLVPEIYMVQFNKSDELSTKSPQITCDCIENKADYLSCVQAFDHNQRVNLAWKERNFAFCPEYDLEGCVAYVLYLNALNMRPSIRNTHIKNWIDIIPEHWDFYRNYLINPGFMVEKDRVKTISDNPEWIPQFFNKTDAVNENSVLLKRENGNESYQNVASDWGIIQTGWAWNSKFSDLDNDGWQDLFIANGYLGWLNIDKTSNIFYKNNEGKGFVDFTKESNLTNFLPAGSYSYFDFDLDGDLDILLTPHVGPVFLYKNNNHTNNSIVFEINDEVGNSFGIGTKIFIYYGNQEHQYRELLLSGGYKSFDQPIVHFGLGKQESIDKIIIEWSTGERTEINQVFESGNKYRLVRKRLAM